MEGGHQIIVLPRVPNLLCTALVGRHRCVMFYKKNPIFIIINFASGLMGQVPQWAKVLSRGKSLYSLLLPQNKNNNKKKQKTMECQEGGDFIILLTKKDEDLSIKQSNVKINSFHNNCFKIYTFVYEWRIPSKDEIITIL